MSDVKLLRGNVSVLFADPEAVADWSAPTSAELNDLFRFGTNEGGMVYDTSCAIVDGYTLGMTDPDTDATRTICDVSNVETPTNDTYEGSIDFLRDESLTDPGIFNMARMLIMGADLTYWVIERIGVPQGTPFAPGQTISMFEFTTDWPIDVIEDNSPIQMTAALKPTGNLHTNYTLEA